jgi:hypothetical protein
MSGVAYRAWKQMVGEICSSGGMAASSSVCHGNIKTIKHQWRKAGGNIESQRRGKIASAAIIGGSAAAKKAQRNVA